MEYIKPHKGFSTLIILGITLGIDLIFSLLSTFINTYIVLRILEIFIVFFNIYQLYYILKSLTLKYCYDNENFYVLWCFGIRRVTIPFKEIEAYNVSHGEIKGVKLWGYGRNFFALGTFSVNDIGIVNMFVTATKNVIYIKCNSSIYGISPEKCDEVKNFLEKRKLVLKNWTYEKRNKVSLSKDRHFDILIFLISIVILMVTIIPFILYLRGVMPHKMPLSFDSNFKPMIYGTSREFAFKHMMYGAYNMIIFFCIYYSAYFYARYSKKLAYRLMYISFLVAFIFLIFQFKIYVTYIH
ncbi:hypothetical protein BJV85_002696 [Clostridium acetobutylicum]|uniref:Uncharacterized protein CA_C1301 n=1 Tax=Clostridium acetobutylicum (strain ATCC 824 / DSM 792 / JCM 1419 / IAM 19013 / LMG 5710 / NBRC 13948 / NRRL B-527 / VKM B-1787 / 2291 / W) TaxID=272562 RepID=Y1301_CLOAB|nr:MULTISPECIES: PH domain-containing protein [Clostridium]P33659.2 RecName: Full=Uncharacterized protein CA_C1301 [Clostridium acetobutylicum ATCC 824]AAK79272.1 Predicted membrane protein [Clostridium acetobutylicum ATCC 824]ADZ20351.1 membrane protein [Clostridium acetobutylicum EA 2018]AEI31750.1 hypothetical protein SMB_G1323 [Clostridium acetobutylicum DSM 1731]AWV81481.1 hypothetical protein DK921_15545 [Clostridium acetobutylicum]MBC2393118.1 hypothetical protein [Clostridium acetobut